MVSLTSKNLNSILNKKNSDKVKKYTTPSDRLSTVMKHNQSYQKKDYIKYSNESCLIYLNPIKLLSNNDVLRIDQRKLTDYKNHCKKRITNLIIKDNKDYKNWIYKTNNKLIKLEYIYAPSHGKKMDTTDGITGAFKYLVDGLVISELIKDDNDDIIPMIIPKQLKGNNEIIIVMTLIEDIDKFYSNEFKKSFNLINNKK